MNSINNPNNPTNPTNPKTPNPQNTLSTNEKAQLLCGASSFGLREFPEYNIPKITMQDGGTGINFEQLFDELYRDEGEGYTPEEFDDVVRKFFREDELTEREKSLRAGIYARLARRCGGIEVAPGCYPPGIVLGATWNPEVVRECGEALGVEARVYGVNVLLGTPNVNLLREPRNGRFFEGYSEDPCLAAALAPQMCEGVEAMGVAANAKHFAANNQEINRIGLDETITARALEELYFPAFKACAKSCSTVMAAYNSINGTKCTENSWLLRDKLRDEWGFEGAVMTDWGACTGAAGDCIEAGVDIIMPGPWPSEDIPAAVADGRLSQAHLDEAASRVQDLIARYSDSSLPAGLTTEKYLERGNRAAYDAASEGIVMLINKDELFPIKAGARERGSANGGASTQVETTTREENSTQEGASTNDAPPATIVFFGNDGSFRDFGGGSAQVFTPRTTNLARELEKRNVNVAFDDFELYRAGAIAVVIESVEAREGSDRADIKLTHETEKLLAKLVGNRAAGSNGGAGKNGDLTAPGENCAPGAAGSNRAAGSNGAAGKNGGAGSNGAAGSAGAHSAGKICLILNTSGPVELGEFEDEIDALYAVFYPGMMGGAAMADIMVGAVNPSGALPISFPRKYEDTPGYLCYPDSFKCNYGEGIYVGYRGYQKRQIAPLFAFGYGLSYTKFELSDVACILAGDQVKASFKIANVGPRDGKTIVQVYARKSFPVKNRPVRELVAFGKYDVAAGAAQTQTLEFDLNKLEYYDEDYGQFMLEQGTYAIEFGCSCDELKASAEVYVEKCSPELSCGAGWTCGQINEVPELVCALAKDVECAGQSFQPFINCVRYTPFDKVSKTFPDCENFTNFMAACQAYRRK